MSSCKIKQLISILNIQDVEDFLFEANRDKDVPWEADKWGDWEMEEDENNLISDAAGEVDNGECSWMQKCLLSISPLMDHMCIAYRDRIAFLNVKSGNLKLCWKDVLSDEGEVSESITEVLCLPLVSLKKSSYGSSDWTCVMVGLSSGYVRLYTENGDLLITQKFHESAVLELSCSTLHSHNHQSTDHKEEVTLLYKDALVILDGFSLFQTLRACRNKLAAATASGATQIPPPPLSYKKWKLMRQENISSHISAGVNVPTPFEQMVSASTLGGFNSEITTNPPAISQYVTCGIGPFVGFYLAIEGSSTPILTEVAMEVANKVKSALYSAASGWLSWGSHNQQTEEPNKNKEPKIDAGTPLDMAFGFPDVGRQGNTIKLAPGTNWLAVTTDSFGRVLLIDLSKGYVLRMWKGYREAQVGFIQTTDDTRKHARGQTKLTALFLCIYAPRRGIVEIWSCINGPRVGAFNISKNARLLSPQFGVLGLNNVSEKSGVLKNRVQCCIIESDGKIKDILVPFHLTLSDANSNKARDIHLLRKVNQFIHAKKRDEIEITKLLGEMMMCSVQKQGIEKILQSRRSGSGLCRMCLEQTLGKIRQRGSNKKEELNFVDYLKSQLTVVNLYDAMCEINKQFVNTETELDENLLCDLLNSNEEALNKVKILFDSYRNSHAVTNVTFQVSESIEIVNFLPCFSFNENGKCSIIDKGSNCQKLGNFLFYSSLFGSIKPADILCKIREHVDVSDKEMLKLVFDCFQDNENIALRNVSKNVEHLVQYIVALSENKMSYTGEVTLTRPKQGLSQWWEWVREEVCLPSKSILTSYIIALACWGVAVKFNKQDSKIHADDTNSENMETDQESESNEISKKDWETLWVDIERWKFIVLQIEDCLLVNVAISLGNHCSTMDKVTENVSVMDLQSNGSGYIAELMAKTCFQADISISIFNPEYKASKEFSEKKVLLKDCIEKDLFSRLPISLSSNVFHSHCFWETIVTWNKDSLVISTFEKALSHLSLISCDPHLQHGLAVMAWNMFIKKRFLALVKLVDKVGKSPKDRLCRKEVEISELSMPKFCEECQNLFEIISSADPDQFPKPSRDAGYEIKMYESNLMVEDAWKDVGGKESIVELGKSQSSTNYSLVQFYLHLLFVVHGIVKFTLNKVKPLTQLFDYDSISYLSMDICNTKLSLNTSDIGDNKVAAYRKQFFAKLITAVVSKMASVDKKEEYYPWVENTIHMAAEFQVDDSLIQLQYVDELFRNGLDLLGHEALKSVSDNDLTASRLLVVLGQRLSHYFLNVCPDDGIILMSQMPTTISSWIKAHDPQQIPKPEVNIEDTIFLAGVVASLLSEDHAQYSIALTLVEIVSSLSL